MPATRNIWKEMWVNFCKTLKYKVPEPQIGSLRGEDYLGNKYYELDADPQGGRRQSCRWFESPTGDRMQEVPPEWESWLRKRRTDPPNEEEIRRNMELAKNKRANVAEFSDQEKPVVDENLNFGKKYWPSNTTFPRCEELERFPGENRNYRK